MAGSASVVRELSDRHLQSVVSLQVQWKDPSQEGREAITSATGSIIQSSVDFLFILTCSHTFKPFTIQQGPEFDSVQTINENTSLQVNFYDGHAELGEAYSIDWCQDMCLVVVTYPLKSAYEPIRFIDEEEDMMGQSVYAREANVYSIYCFPTNQKDKKCLFGTATKGEICGRNDIVGNDLDPAYRSDLRIFQYDMAGAGGCSGAPIFNKDFLFIGMWLSRVADLKFALKLNQIREWALTWFDITGARTMNEIVAEASVCMSEKMAEVQVDVSSMEMEIEGVDLSSLEILDGLDLY